MLLFLLVHFFSKNSSVAQEHTSDHWAPFTDTSCDDITNCRRLFSIVWSCFTTIFACTWISVHPNVPPPYQNRISLLGRRLRMMFVGIFAPELMVGFAARQFFAARMYTKKFDISKTHGFFISMGGFVSRCGRHPITSLKQLEDRPEYIEDIREVEREDIRDKSKGDALSKGVALAQGLWFTTQYLARLHQHLPITELEVATLAFAVVNIFIWVLWWRKPLDIERPIPVGPNDEPEQRLEDVQRTFSFSTWGALTGYYDDYAPVLSSAVPSFWAMQTEDVTDFTFVVFGWIESLVGVIFGAIHCAAWTADFPSVEEMWMWRASSLLVAAIPLAMAFLFGFDHSFLRPSATISLRSRKKNAVKWNSRRVDNLVMICLFILIPLYILARLFLVILPFTTLRALPAGTFIDVNWSVYIPHL